MLRKILSVQINIQIANVSIREYIIRAEKIDVINIHWNI